MKTKPTEPLSADADPSATEDDEPIRYVICRRYRTRTQSKVRGAVMYTEYWSGQGWTCFGSVAKRYDPDVGVALINKRFNRHMPRPRLVIETHLELKGKLVKWPDKRLTQVCDKASEGMDYGDVVKAMIMTQKQHRGLGISAPQIGEMLRIIVVEDLVIINPIIVKRSKKMAWFKEGCLSFPKTCPKYKKDDNGKLTVTPGKPIRVRRHKQVTVNGFDLNWNPIVTKGRDWKGACLQHEIDHLDGITLDNHSNKN